MEWTSWHEKHSDKIELVAGIDCWIWIGAQGSHGYGRVSYHRKSSAAHRVAFIESGGSFQDGNLVRHLCGNPFCVRPAHLKAGTPKDNAQDTSKMFRCKGSQSPAVIFGVRTSYSEGMPLQEISRLYGLAQGSIVQIATGRVYSEVLPDMAVKPNRTPRKLDREKAGIIRARIANGERQAALAKEFNVASSAISRINTGKRWTV
ncbi:HNH endonuclease [Paracoccus sp. NGMCC 1.201697]|uniref:HNH endonuclease n=1 Tax=Paracoccus broussonetiae subsp. drimophilus TaxID=3373869 RepID=A0ABW7LH58_9RHOB